LNTQTREALTNDFYSLVQTLGKSAVSSHAIVIYHGIPCVGFEVDGFGRLKTPGLVGGRYESTDKSFDDTLRRELEEEFGVADFTVLKHEGVRLGVGFVNSKRQVYAARLSIISTKSTITRGASALVPVSLVYDQLQDFSRKELFALGFSFDSSKPSAYSEVFFHLDGVTWMLVYRAKRKDVHYDNAFFNGLDIDQSVSAHVPRRDMYLSPVVTIRYVQRGQLNGLLYRRHNPKSQGFGPMNSKNKITRFRIRMNHGFAAPQSHAITAFFNPLVEIVAHE
jgi:hypothetical protein